MTDMREALTAIRRLLHCPALNLDKLEEEDLDAIEQAEAVLEGAGWSIRTAADAPHTCDDECRSNGCTAR